GGDRSFRPASAGRRGSLPHAGPGSRLSGSGAAGPAGTVKHIIKATQKALHRVMQSLFSKSSIRGLYAPFLLRLTHFSGAPGMALVKTGALRHEQLPVSATGSGRCSCLVQL